MSPRRARVTRRRGSPATPRRGFSLIEVMIALVLLSVGMLALVGSAGSIARTMAGSASEMRRTQLVQSRLDALRSGGCGQVGSGSEKERGISLSWTSTAVPRGVAVTLTASYTGRGATRSTTYRTVIAC